MFFDVWIIFGIHESKVINRLFSSDKAGLILRLKAHLHDHIFYEQASYLI